MDEVAAQARDISTKASNMPVGLTPGPPQRWGIFMPMTPSSAKALTWRVTEPPLPSMSAAWAPATMPGNQGVVEVSSNEHSLETVVQKDDSAHPGP